MKSNIRKLRKEQNISQTELAKVLGKTQQTVSHMEKDRDRISIESLVTMADYFGVSTDYILGIKPEEKEHEKEETAELSSREEPPNKEKEVLENIIDKGDTKNIIDKGDTNKIMYEIVLTLLLRSLKEELEPASEAGQ